ncbi:MAG: hypothetical protein QUS14_15905 [Pyrinomonadaceae bacterium]|nr:hypothetical protein [Pyrinomonadaceae bacterium]
MAIDNTLDRRGFERRLFLICAAGFAILSFAGFARTYYLLPVLGGNPLRLTTHIHGILMSLWVLLFAVQIYLVRSKNIRVHMRLGWLGVGLAAMIVAVGTLTALMAAKYGSQSSPPEIPPLSFLIVPIGDILYFGAFVALAVLWRKRPADHKRMMLLTAFAVVPAAVARIPGAPMQELGPLWFWGVPNLLLIAVIAADRWRTGKFNLPFVIGSILLIASEPVRMMLMGTEAWLAFATWATSFV